jgi:UDP-N-acetylglucosamine 4,6-dehydratase/5-epimerase
MTRFFMTIPDAVNLVLNATPIAIGGEIFILKLPAVRIKDLAEVCAKRYAHPPANVVVGRVRPGEKVHEALLTDAEAPMALETDDYFIVVPQIPLGDLPPGNYVYKNARQRYSDTYKTTTANILSHDEISALIDRAESM